VVVHSVTNAVDRKLEVNATHSDLWNLVLVSVASQNRYVTVIVSRPVLVLTATAAGEEGQWRCLDPVCGNREAFTVSDAAYYHS
jgi:hypothetical protein